MAGIPKNWDAAAHALWTAGEQSLAIQAAFAQVNQADPAKGSGPFAQAGYYLFLKGDMGAAAATMDAGSQRFPADRELLLNAAVAFARTGQHAAAIERFERYVAAGGTDFVAFDGLCHSASKLGDHDAARRHGALALARKDEATADERGTVKLAGPGDIDARARVISFSLWGSHPRYLRGALHNVLAARQHLPGWTCRFAIDRSVDSALIDALRGEGAEISIDERGDLPARDRLTRRFLVADDHAVGRFLVRDCDSVVGAREAAAVADWMRSPYPFHVMRDWWTHTDPILAGMWGGIAGVFPDLAGAVAAYRPKTMETPNWDQWFLRDRVWPIIRDAALIHDRLFDSYRAVRFPDSDPTDNFHVGQNEWQIRREAQQAALTRFARAAPALGIDKPKLEVRITPDPR